MLQYGFEQILLSTKQLLSACLTHKLSKKSARHARHYWKSKNERFLFSYVKLNISKCLPFIFIFGILIIIRNMFKYTIFALFSDVQMFSASIQIKNNVMYSQFIYFRNVFKLNDDNFYDEILKRKSNYF